MQSKINDIGIFLPKGFPKDLHDRVKSFVEKLVLAESLDILPDDKAKEFWRMTKNGKKIDEDCFSFLEENMPEHMDELLSKIQKQISKIIEYDIKAIYV